MTRDYARIVEELERLIRLASKADGGGSSSEVLRLVVDALWDGLRGTGVSWVGIYFEVPEEPADRRLVLGPCRDKPACSPIGLHGVCGQALTSGRTRIIWDVRELGEAYVACDPLDRSEIVIPIDNLAGCEGLGLRRVRGVLDLDSHEVGSFSVSDDKGLRGVLAAAGISAVVAGQ